MTKTLIIIALLLSLCIGTLIGIKLVPPQLVKVPVVSQECLDLRDAIMRDLNKLEASDSLYRYMRLKGEACDKCH